MKQKYIHESAYLVNFTHANALQLTVSFDIIATTSIVSACHNSKCTPNTRTIIETPPTYQLCSTIKVAHSIVSSHNHLAGLKVPGIYEPQSDELVSTSIGSRIG